MLVGPVDEIAALNKQLGAKEEQGTVSVYVCVCWGG